MTEPPPGDDPLAEAKYLPGLEGDPGAAVLENWTSSDYDTWFKEHVESSEAWNGSLNDILQLGFGADGMAQWTPNGDLEEALFVLARNQAWIDFETDLLARTTAARVVADILPVHDFRALSKGTKEQFFRGWYQRFATMPAPASPEEAGWHRASEEYETTTTLPSGYVVTETSDESGGTGIQELTDATHRTVARLPVEREPLKGATLLAGETSAPPRGSPADDALVGAAGGVSMLGIPVSRAVLTVVAAVAAAAVLALIGASFLGGGGDSTELPASGGGDASGGTDGVSSASTEAAGGSSAGAPAAAGSCRAAHERQDLVELSSPDVQPSIPRVTYIGNVDAGFPSPRFEWSAMPPETTEIAILVQSLRPDRTPGYQEDEQLWWRQEPVGVIVWLVTGIDPAARSLPVTSLADPPPGDAIQHQHENGRRNDYDQQFWIQQDDRPHLFTVFALCDPQLDGTANDYSPYWLRQHAVAVGWFFSTRGQ